MAGHVFPKRASSVVCAAVCVDGERCTRSSTYMFCDTHEDQVYFLTAKQRSTLVSQWVSLMPEAAGSLADLAFDLVCAESQARDHAIKRDLLSLTRALWFTRPAEAFSQPGRGREPAAPE